LTRNSEKQESNDHVPSGMRNWACPPRLASPQAAAAVTASSTAASGQPYSFPRSEAFVRTGGGSSCSHKALSLLLKVGCVWQIHSRELRTANGKPVAGSFANPPEMDYISPLKRSQCSQSDGLSCQVCSQIRSVRNRLLCPVRRHRPSAGTSVLFSVGLFSNNFTNRILSGSSSACSIPRFTFRHAYGCW
jgi:hypothetical protein